MPRFDLLAVLVIAAACAALTAAAMGRFEPLPLFGGVILAGVVRNWRLAQKRG